ncbi:MAG: hypothetical protein LBS19_06175 [Clostridiales bacterium]|nr:hypothetical protein [Clostridiales bacterium]
MMTEAKRYIADTDERRAEALERLEEVCRERGIKMVLCRCLPGFHIWLDMLSKELYIDINSCECFHIKAFLASR